MLRDSTYKLALVLVPPGSAMPNMPPDAAVTVTYLDPLILEQAYAPHTVIEHESRLLGLKLGQFIKERSDA